MDDGRLSDHARRNLAVWDGWAADYVEEGRRSWAEAPSWGMWGVLEAELGVLPDVAGRDVVELGCGTAYQSAWLARRGARPVGVDLSSAQLATARALQRTHALAFPLVRASAERVPLRDGTFDLALSEYGACLWCDPRQWLAEAARLLRPGGRLVFLSTSYLLYLAMDDADDVPAADRLRRPQFAPWRVQWPGHESVEFHPSHSEWIDALRGHGFEIERLIELQVPSTAITRYPFVDAEWASRWPSEEIWIARRR